ncbi:Nuclear pore complex protein NUP98A [Camellia lanceoleosa]|uniref:Nuclear pore complex protein NUP98A n=1 Tax=Camellia lanceoleosa TaxID=1840588 RepID=A0ACC0I7S5_9ERIC|nr:Nuclear pore complex protein NUP98A [Camellia lanceoleosa]
MPPLSIGHPGSIPSIQYGISSMPVTLTLLNLYYWIQQNAFREDVLDEPAAPVRMPSLLTSRHLSQSRIRLPARKYDPKSDGPKVPFFRNDKEMTTTPKTDALFVPRENPRATATSNIEKRSLLEVFAKSFIHFVGEPARGRAEWKSLPVGFESEKQCSVAVSVWRFESESRFRPWKWRWVFYLGQSRVEEQSGRSKVVGEPARGRAEWKKRLYGLGGHGSWYWWRGSWFGWAAEWFSGCGLWEFSTGVLGLGWQHR